MPQADKNGATRQAPKEYDVIDPMVMQFYQQQGQDAGASAEETPEYVSENYMILDHRLAISQELPIRKDIAK